MRGGQFSHFRDKMSLARDTGHRGSIPGTILAIPGRLETLVTVHTNVISDLQRVAHRQRQQS